VRERRWVGMVSVAVLVLLLATTVGAVLATRQQLDRRLAAAAATVAATVRHDVQLNLQRDVAAATGLARSVTDVTAVDAGVWTAAVQDLTSVGAFTEVAAVNLLAVADEDEVEATLAALPDEVRASLDLRLAEGPVHAVGIAVWPEDANRQVLGYDVFANELVVPAVRGAIRWVTVHSTQPVQVVQEPEGQRSTVFYVPVVGDADEEEVTAVIGLVFRAGALLERIVSRLPQAAAVRWTDASPDLEGDDALLAEVGDPTVDGATAAEVVAAIGRTYRIEVTLPRTALSPAERRAPLLVGALGVVLSLGLFVTSLGWRHAAVRADRLVAARTAALSEATADLEAANRELLEFDRLKDRMIDTVSHDLRSPLTVIRGAAQVLLERPDLPVEDRHELLERVARQASRIRGLTDELLVAAQVRSGNLTADRRPLELRPLLRIVTADLGVGELRPGGEVPPVRADRLHVERIVHNLLVNAVNHGAPPIEVEVATGASPGTVEVRVRDHGAGVPPELQERIFAEFGRAADAGPGYGLGLAIATELARANGGSLAYREMDAPGACFVLTLPVA
jgi:signal transduction histidine kinase